MAARTMIGIAVVGALLAAGAMVAAKKRPHAKGRLGAADPATVASLRHDVAVFCAIGERSTLLPENLSRAAELIEREFSAAGYEVERQTYDVVRDGARADNLIVELRGSSRPDEIVVIGAHYDSVTGTVGADDNASGVAALLALARRFREAKPARTLRFVAFVNEEPPHFQTETMGSWQYAKRAHERGEKIVAMLSLEAVGYYSDAPGSQQYPPPLSFFYPGRGNFIGFVANTGSRSLLRRSLRTFRRSARFPSEGAALPPVIREAGWSDQWSFWQFGYPALMVTDTAVFRNPHYHRPTDTAETLDYDRTARVVEGLLAVARELAR